MSNGRRKQFAENISPRFIPSIYSEFYIYCCYIFYVLLLYILPAVSQAKDDIHEENYYGRLKIWKMTEEMITKTENKKKKHNRRNKQKKQRC